MTYIPYRLIRTVDLDGRPVDMLCPGFCTQSHAEGAGFDAPATASDRQPYDWTWHVGTAFALNAPGDFYDKDGPYRVLHAELSAEPLDDGTFSEPYIYLDTLDAGQGDRFDVAHTDQFIRDLKVYTARLQQLRDRLAALTGEDR